jgi:hypothetical protein
MNSRLPENRGAKYSNRLNSNAQGEFLFLYFVGLNNVTDNERDVNHIKVQVFLPNLICRQLT